MKLPMEKFVVNIDKYGNTSAASIPLALTEGIRKVWIRLDDKLLMVSFGAVWLRSSRCSLLRLVNGLFQIGIVKPEDFWIAKDEQLIRPGGICFLEDL